MHRATWPHRGTKPRVLAQPEIGLHEPFTLQDGPDTCPVERVILRGLTTREPAARSDILRDL
jgi:hypothetical protein